MYLYVQCTSLAVQVLRLFVFLLIYLPLTCLLKIDRCEIKGRGFLARGFSSRCRRCIVSSCRTLYQSINQSRKSVMLVDKHRQVVYSTYKNFISSSCMYLMYIAGPTSPIHHTSPFSINFGHPTFRRGCFLFFFPRSGEDDPRG